jgi:holo-[acyl-carrier protein] synthase
LASCQYNRNARQGAWYTVLGCFTTFLSKKNRWPEGASVYKSFDATDKRNCMIIGLGIDVEDVERVKGAIERQGERFLRRIFTEKERTYCEQFKDKYERYAGRFAVKEAAMKALGTGWSRGVRWVDIEVLRRHGSRPTLELRGEARKIADKLGVKNIAISMTHTPKQAMAQVIFET